MPNPWETPTPNAPLAQAEPLPSGSALQGADRRFTASWGSLRVARAATRDDREGTAPLQAFGLFWGGLMLFLAGWCSIGHRIIPSPLLFLGGITLAYLATTNPRALAGLRDLARNLVRRVGRSQVETLLISLVSRLKTLLGWLGRSPVESLPGNDLDPKAASYRSPASPPRQDQMLDQF